jgi:hypothetical protein
MVWGICGKCPEDDRGFVEMILHRFATTSKIKNRCRGFWWNVFEIFFGGREEI